MLNFKRRTKYPVITKNCESVKRFKYLVTANTVYKIFEGKQINVALFDKNCRIIHLLPRLISKSRSVYVYTECVERYEAENQRILSLIGAAAVISDNPILPRGTDAVISADNTYFDDILTFGEYGYFAENSAPVFRNSHMLSIPKYSDIYCVLTGLLKVGKIKYIADAYCEKLSKNGCEFCIKNLP